MIQEAPQSQDPWPYQNQQNSLKESELRIRNLFENLSIGVVVHGPDTNIIFSNQTASSFLGLTSDQLVGKMATDPRWHFTDENGLTINVEDFPVYRVLSSGQPIKGLVIGVVRPDLSHPLWGLCNAYAEYDEDHKVSHVVVTFTDITEQKNLSEKLSELSILFEAALDQSQAGIAIADAPTGKLRYVNQAAHIFIGGRPEEQVSDIKVDELMSSWKISDLHGKRLSYEESPFGKVIIKAEKISQEFIIKNSADEDRIIWVNAAPIFGVDQKLIAGITVFLDTTERHRLEKELRSAKNVAEYATMLKSRFLDVAAHELRTPVTALSILIQMTLKQKTQGHTIEIETIKKLKGQVERISHLVVDLLDVSRLEKGMVHLKREQVSVITLIHECLSEFNLKNPDREILFYPKEKELLFNLDPNRIFQVMSNLIDNAIKYTPQTSPITVEVHQHESALRVSVTDKGQGLSSIQQATLFSPFSRGSSELTEKSGGLGLGLFISRMIVELHGGKIGVESEIGMGSTFYFEIPREIKSE